MPFEINEPLFGGETFWFRIPDVKLNDVQVTAEATTRPDTFTWLMTDDLGSPIVGQAGDMNPSASAPGTWEAVLVAPTGPARYHVHATATKGPSIGKWHDEFRVQRYT